VADTADLPENCAFESLTAEELMEVAQQAAAAGQPVRMLEALAASRFLDGLVRRLESNWRGRLPSPEIEECVAQAINEAYVAVVHSTGLFATSVPGFGKPHRTKRSIAGTTITLPAQSSDLILSRTGAKIPNSTPIPTGD
jgi:hypothetical protein